MLVRGGGVRLGRARLDAGFFSRLRGSTEARIRLFCLRRRSLSGIPPLAQRRRLTVEELSPGHVCRGFFHWNADVVPLCCRKPATKGRRLLCAATDASSLPSTASAFGSKRLPSPGTAISGRGYFLATAELLRAGGRPKRTEAKSGIFSDYFADEKPSAKPPALAIRA